MHNKQRLSVQGWIFFTAPLVALLLLAALYSEFGGSRDTQTAALPTLTTITADIQGAAGIVYDAADKKVLYAKNPQEQLPLASITKVMLALVVSEHFDPNSIVYIPYASLALEGDEGLLANEAWRLGDLIDFTLVESSNDGADALARHLAEKLTGNPNRIDATIQKMNEKARELNLPQTYFLNPTGLDESLTLSGSYSSARDVAQLLLHVYTTKPELIAATARDGILVAPTNGFEKEAENTNEALGYIPGLIGGKTGFTDLAGGNLGVVFDVGIGQPVIAVVLHSGKDERFEDIKVLTQAARRTISAR